MNNPNFAPRYNVAPTQDIQVVREGAEGRELVNMRWGLVPHWSKEPKANPLMINAKAETIEEKPAFREAFKKRRCLIVADGYFEWTPDGKGKQPWYVTVKGVEMFGFAAVWESWREKGSSEAPLQSSALITTIANDYLAPIHERMPVIFRTLEEYNAWLDPHASREQLLDMLKPLPSNSVEARKVGPAVNNWRYDGPDCIAPMVEPIERQGAFAL